MFHKTAVSEPYMAQFALMYIGAGLFQISSEMVLFMFSHIALFAKVFRTSFTNLSSLMIGRYMETKSFVSFEELWANFAFPRLQPCKRNIHQFFCICFRFRSGLSFWLVLWGFFWLIWIERNIRFLVLIIRIGIISNYHWIRYFRRLLSIFFVEFPNLVRWQWLLSWWCYW